MSTININRNGADGRVPITRRRRGLSYVMFLGSATVVMVIGLSGLAAARVQRRAAEGGRDVTNARLVAYSAVERAFALIAADANWRTAVAGVAIADQWVGDCATGVTVTILDNANGDPTDDPAYITGAAKCGTARHKMRVTVVPDRGGLIISPGSWTQVPY